jgi:hypothetical protein
VLGSSASFYGEIIAFGLWERKQGYREWTVRASVQALKSLARRANLLEQESVKEYPASAKISESRKAKPTCRDSTVTWQSRRASCNGSSIS